MKLTCSLEKLKNAVGMAERMTGKNLTLPILQAVLLSAQKNTLTVRATNLGVGIEIEIPAHIQEEGTVALRADVLANICNNTQTSKELTLSSIGENISVQSEKNNTLIKCLPHEEFPSLPVVEGETITIKNSLILQGLRSVSFAVATSEIKPEIASIYIYSEHETLYFVATDSFRLAEKKIVSKGIPDIAKILIPYKSIGDLIRLLDSLGEVSTLSYTRNQLSLTSGGVYFTTRLIDGGFPTYQIIIPKEETTKIVVMKQELINTLRLSTTFTDTFSQITLTINPEQKSVTISSKNNDIGSSQATIDAVITGEPIEISCNLRYFLDVFQAIEGDSVSLSFTTTSKPILIQSPQDKNFLYLLMPANR